MTAEAVPAASDRSWLRTFADALGLGALGFGGALLLAMAGGFVVWELSLGRVTLAGIPADASVVHNARTALIHILGTAYLMAACVQALRAGDQALTRVMPLVDPLRGKEAEPRRSVDSRVLLVAGLIGALAWLVATVVSPGQPELDPRLWSAEVTWHRVLGATMGILGGRLSALLIMQSVRLSRLALGIREIDLLDADALSPFARQGLSNALLVLGFAAVLSLFLLDPGYLPIVLPIWALASGVAGGGLLLPMLGVRRRVQQAKRSELAWCRDRMRQARLGLTREPSAAPSTSARLDELVAWERRIQEVREWPLDTTAVARFALYLLIPLGSWSGGALVERLIDALVG